MLFSVFVQEHHSFWGRITEREKVDFGLILGRSGKKRPVCLKIIVTGKLASSWSHQSPDLCGVFSPKMTFGVLD